jgi:hypothetical protein
MGPRCSSAETQVCHRSYIIAASVLTAKKNPIFTNKIEQIYKTTYMQLVVTIGKHSCLNRQIWYRHLNSEAGNDEIQNFQREDFYFVGITF